MRSGPYVRCPMCNGIATPVDTGERLWWCDSPPSECTVRRFVHEEDEE